MSRGLGKIEREIVAVLSDNREGLRTLEIAALVFNPNGPTPELFWPVSDAQHASVRRALLSLRKKDLAFRLHRTHPNGEFLWANRERGLNYVRRLRNTGMIGFSGSPDIMALLQMLPPA